MAKEILEELKLNFLISSKVSRKRSEDINLRFYDNNPMYLKAAVSFYEYIIRKHFDNNISKAFHKIFNKQIPDVITEGDSGSSSINIALAFISYEANVEFSTLRKKFYDTKYGINDQIKEIKLYEFPDYIDEIILKEKVDKNILKNYKKELDKTNLHFEKPLLY